MIRLIWAMTEDRLIGNKNRMPWHIKEDLLYYKQHTEGQTVLMGEATYASLKGYYKNKSLPYGKIYVASLNPNLTLEDATIVNDVENFLKQVEEDLWVVGGATIYKLSLPYADALYISWIQGTFTGDTYFPEIDFTSFRLTWQENTELVHYTIYERV